MPTSARPTRRFGASAALVAVVLLASGCGSQRGPITSGDAPQSSGLSSGLSTGLATDTTSTSGVPSKVAFPLTLQRTGGIAGVHDAIVITDVGKVIVQKGSGTDGYVCQLTAAARPKIEAAIASQYFGFISPPPVEKSEAVDLFYYSLTAADGKKMHGSELVNPIDSTLIELLRETTEGDGSGNTLCLRVPAAS